FTSPRCPDHKSATERVGFEPTIPFRVYTLSRRAPSAARPSLRNILSSGERRIRTYGTVTGTPDFESGAFDHSASSPTPSYSVFTSAFLRRRKKSANKVLHRSSNTERVTSTR